MAKYCNYFEMWCREVKADHGPDCKEECDGSGCNDSCDYFEEVES